MLDVRTLTSDQLLCVLREEARERAIKVRQSRLGSTVLVAGLLFGWIYMWLGFGTTPAEFLKLYGAFFLVALGGVALTTRHRSALLQVDTSEPRLVEYLVDALSYRDSEVTRHAEVVLTSTLPRVTALPGSSEEKLAAHLEVSQDNAFIRSSLDALRRLGSAACLADLDRFASSAQKSDHEKFRPLALSVTADIRLRIAKEVISDRTSHPPLARMENKTLDDRTE